MLSHTQFNDSEDLKNELLEEIKKLENETSSKDEFVHKMWDCPKIMEMSDHTPDLVTTISPSFQRFWDTIWQAFKRVLEVEKLELA